MRGLIVAALFATAIVTAPPAAAQSLFDKLKGAAEKVTGSGSGDASGGAADLATEEIVARLREALRVGTESVVGQVGAADGYNTDPDIHIPLPDSLQTAQTYLRKFGLSSLADEVELKLNRAAEAAAPKTKELIWTAISEMTLDDAKRIYDGPDDAATQYFKRIASADLTDVVKPVVDQALDEVGAIAAYDDMMGEYTKLPLVPDVKANLSDHTVGLALQGLFHYLAKEKAAIRNNPAKRTTEILAKVFGN